LKEKGISNTAALLGRFRAWAEANLPIEP
jgi:rhodanese-related sulfurtransferase